MVVNPQGKGQRPITPRQSRLAPKVSRRDFRGLVQRLRLLIPIAPSSWMRAFPPRLSHPWTVGLTLAFHGPMLHRIARTPTTTTPHHTTTPHRTEPQTTTHRGPHRTSRIVPHYAPYNTPRYRLPLHPRRIAARRAAVLRRFCSPLQLRLQQPSTATVIATRSPARLPVANLPATPTQA